MFLKGWSVSCINWCIHFNLPSIARGHALFRLPVQLVQVYYLCMNINEQGSNGRTSWQNRRRDHS